MNFSNLKIGYRLAIGFSFIIVMLLITGSVALSKLSEFNRKMNYTVSTLYPVTAKGHRLIEELNNALMGQQLILMLDSKEEIRQRNEETRKNSAEITALLSDLSSHANDERSASLLRDIQQLRAEYSTSGNKLMELASRGDKQSAIAELLHVSLQLQKKYKAKIAEFIDYQDDQMVASSENVQRSYTEIKLGLWLVLIFSIIAGGIIAWWMTRSVTHPLRDAVKLAERVSTGDLTFEPTVCHQDETGQLLHALYNMNDSLRNIVGQVRDGAETISSAASQIAAGNQDLSARTEEQASSLEQTAASVEQLTATIKNTTENTNHAASLAGQASDIVRQSGEMMANVTREMREIHDGSQRMAEIVSVIDSIAFQTNILALNAAVEAARAGEQGRGFAVVASEVRALAQRSANSAKEIKALIDSSVQRIKDGMLLVENTEQTMDEVINNAHHTGGIIREIAQASQEQSDGINQINLAVGQIDVTTQQNAALVEESAAAALSLQEQAHALAKTVSVFKLGAQATQAVWQHQHSVLEAELAVLNDKERVRTPQWATF
ncbi:MULTISPECIES: methyl-accepting chemotaxis protein [Dickeya]|uniref:Methyl-accepting chemotaxis protein I (Serine chemoreceptor protein) n=1 Tax=Dickeya aquatica TaxID=1401087 RepID=A0A375ACB5_9GAMM|nr:MULTISPECIES: methyl-accepting chemotaxis protein [Dickeya]SLM63713.1 Methyl-accepting chemotaxis protein I (serine chemoreceptor protein) [Dickeya aquatica]